MKSFKTFISEAASPADYKGVYQNMSLEEFEVAVSNFIAQKEILNPEFKVLIEYMARAFAKYGKDINIKTWNDGKARPYGDMGYDDSYPNWNPIKGVIQDLFGMTIERADSRYSQPMSSSLFLSLGKKIKQAEKDGAGKEPPVIEIKKFYERYKGLAENAKELKKYSVKMTTIRAIKKEKESMALNDMRTNAQTMVDALMSQIEEAKKTAGQKASEHVENTWKELDKMGWDIGDLMIKNNQSFGQGRYKDVINLYKSVTETDPKSQQKNVELGNSPRLGDRFRVKSQSLKKRFVDQSIQSAEDEYKSFVNKMVQKVGAGIVDASVKGHPWVRSVLSVDMADGSEQIWHTTIKVNYSKYGRGFYQFPSIRKK